MGLSCRLLRAGAGSVDGRVGSQGFLLPSLSVFMSWRIVVTVRDELIWRQGLRPSQSEDGHDCQPCAYRTVMAACGSRGFLRSRLQGKCPSTGGSVGSSGAASREEEAVGDCFSGSSHQRRRDPLQWANQDRGKYDLRNLAAKDRGGGLYVRSSRLHAWWLLLGTAEKEASDPVAYIGGFLLQVQRGQRRGLEGCELWWFPLG